MKRVARREFVKASVAGGLMLALRAPLVHAGPQLQASDPASEVRVGIVGLGGINTVGGVGGRGRQLMNTLRSAPGARIVALCDVDETVLNREVEQFQKRGEPVAAHVDLRRLLDDKNIDAVAIATPNHWHALATIWACQAGKDVYVEKPFSHDIWEGRQMVAAARKYNRMVQVGTQSRSSAALRDAFAFIRDGAIGPIRCVHAIVYRAREGIGQVDSPTPVPSSVNYDLWCGPDSLSPLMRKQLHYEWHWFWSTGNGEIGNNGAHSIDIARWALGQNQPPPRAMSIGGRFGFHDVGETPNTQIAIMDYQPAPLICEVRNLRAGRDVNNMGTYRGANGGIVIECADGHCAATTAGVTVFDRQGTEIKRIDATRELQELEQLHMLNFLAAVRDRNVSQLNAEALEGHRSATCCHMANISYRLGKSQPPREILERIRESRELSDAFERCREYLLTNGVDLMASPAVVGPWVTLDADQERFVNEFAAPANELSHRVYREPFTVPQIS